MPSVEENSFLNSSSSQVVVKNSDKNMNGVTAEFIETFSGLKLEITDDTKSAGNKICPDRIEAKISIKEKNNEPVCLSCFSEGCCKKSGLTRKKDEKINLPLTSDLLIDRAPCRNGRKHCKERLTCPTLGYGQRNAESTTYVDNLSLCSSFSPTYLPSQYLHCNGGCFSEANTCGDQTVQSVASFTDDQFSPSSLSSTSSAYSSSPSSLYSYMSPKNVTHNESEDSGHDSPGIEELYPSPPSSVVGCLSPLFEDISCNTECDFEAAQFTACDDLFEDISTSVPPKEKINDSSATSQSFVPTEKIENIKRYLKDGELDPKTSQLVKNIIESLGEATSPSVAHSNNHQEVKKDNSNCVNVNAAQLPSVSSLCRSENVPPQQTFLVMPCHLQAVAVVGPKEKHQRQIKPNIVPVHEPKVDEKRCQNVKEPTNRNSVLREEFKSVKDKISALMTREEKNRLLKLELEKEPPENGKMNILKMLNLAASKGNVKLAYVLVETTRTKIRSENSKTDNPRIFTKQKIQAFINVQDSQGLTPLYYAVLAGNNLLVAYLLECGADPFIKDFEHGNTSYHVAARKGDSAVIPMELLSFRRDISDVRNNKGQTILMAAVMSHNEHCRGIELIKHLLRKNHMLTPQDNDGRTALHIAVMKKDIELIELLLTYPMDAKEAKLIKDNNGNTILHVAATLSDIEIETHKRLLQTIIMHCPSLTEVPNKERKLPYQLVEENKIQERDLLYNKMDELGFRNL